MSQRALMRQVVPVLAVVAVSLVADGRSAAAVTTQVPGKLIVIKSGKLAKFVSKPSAIPFPTPPPGGSSDPTTVDASFSVVDDADNSRAFFANLPQAQWDGLGNPAGSKGYKYRGAGTLSDPCRIVLVKGNVIKAVCKDDQFLDPPLVGAPAVKLRLGADSYAARFAGTTVKNIPGTYKASSAPECTPSGLCCDGKGFHAFTTATAAGDCGDTLDLFGTQVLAPHPDLSCSSLYYGGGGQAMPLPLTFPTQEQTVTEITSCSGQSATLGPTTSAATGSSRNCSAPGCTFGPPVAFPNPTTTPVSVCVLFSVQGAVSGTLDCDTGAQTLDLPLGAQVFLTGDGDTDPGGTIPGIQPCPLCSAGLCVGGQNNGMGCAPSSVDGSTTHDCPPTTSLDISTVPLAFALSSGTVSWTATTATNDTPTTAGEQSRIFSGYCRDMVLPGATSCFAGSTSVGCPLPLQPIQKCWENGMAVGPPCSGSYETCQQRNNGAFGPNGGAIQTITVFGQPQDGIRCGVSTGVLASQFGIPIVDEPVVDSVADFPGPAAVTLPVVGALCDTAATCPLAGP